MTAGYDCTGTLLPNLNLWGGKTTALVGPPQTDQWEGRDASNLDRDASLARNIARKTDAIPRGDRNKILPCGQSRSPLSPEEVTRKH